MRTALWSSLVVLAACNQDYEILADHPNVDPGDVTECGFTPISGTRLSVYDCNPVFAGTGESWGPDVDAVGFHTTEVLGHPFYQIWYSAHAGGGDYGDWGLGYAVSGDGTAWDAHPDNPLLRSEAGAWDSDAMDGIQVVWDPTSEQYLMAYQGFNLNRNTWGMGIATSFDGVSWNKLPSNPVLDFSGGIGSVDYCWPLAVHLSGSGVYTGYVAGGPSGTQVCQIYPVSASDPATWSPSTTPALQAGPELYDRSGMAAAAVVEFDGTWYMFYVGFESWENMGTYISSKTHSLNLATSTDGVHWTKSPDNPFPVNLSADKVVSAVGAQVVGERIHLWVTDYYDSVGGYAVGYYYYEPDVEPHP